MGRKNKFLVGERYGHLLVIEDLKYKKWKCLCDCGNECISHTNSLESGKIICGRKDKHRDSRVKDLLGKRFGMLTVQSFKESNAKQKAYWNCVCDCGNKTIVRGAHLISGNIKSCGCLVDTKLEGKRFGKLVVIKDTCLRTSMGRHKIWECLCDCGNKKNISTKLLHSGSTKSCGCLPKDLQISFEDRKLSHIKSKIKSTCRLRNLRFDLSDEFIKNISFKNCQFCNGVPDTLGFVQYKGKDRNEFFHIGIDRKDSSVGYTEKNCVPCCKKCNWMKRDLSITDWLGQMKKILEFYK